MHISKIIVLATACCLTGTVTMAQEQLRNGNFESWENSKTTKEEPTYWNGLMSADLCMFCSFGASQRVFRDSNEKIEGKYSIRIESKSILGGLIVNGTVTNGRVVAPSASPSIGFSQSVLSNEDFNHPFESRPDSVVFWAKYSITNATDSALVSLFLHGDEALKDPDHDRESKKLIAKCRQSFQTNGKWQRFSFHFQYTGNSARTQYILATFSSSFKAGKGNGDAVLWIDDVRFIYNNESLSTSFLQ